MGHALDFAEEMLGRSSVSSQIVSETMVIFEALLTLIIMQGFGSNTVIDVSKEGRLGDVSL